MHEAIVCHLLRENGTEKEVLLGRRGELFCTDVWNGPGGKMKSGESMFACTRRECREEIRVKVNMRSAEHFATADFFHKHLDKHRLEWRVHYIRATQWGGTPETSQAFKELKWFPLQDLPYEKMMADQIAWLPLAISYTGEKLLQVRIWYGDKDLKIVERGEFHFVDRPN